MEMVLFRNGIWDMLRKINDSVDQVFSPLADAHHITMMQMRLLMELYQGGEHTIGSLAKALSLTGGNASSMCKRLEREGHLARIRDSNDERVVNLRLTEKGEKIVRNIEECLDKRFRTCLLEKYSNDFSTIYEGFRLLTQMLEEIKTLA